MTITLEKITIEGFGSIQGPFTYQLDTPGINLILGENGVGKTTIFNALAWCLYKQTLKKGCSIDPWGKNQGKKFRGTCVSVNFRDDKNSYQVTRCKDYRGNVGKPNQKGGNKLFFFKNGDLDEKKYKSNIQPLIERSLGYSYNLFKNAILFGQEVERLMKESGPNKRAVFEEAFDTSFLEDAKNKVNARLNANQTEEKILLHNVETFETTLKDFDENTKYLIQNLDESISEVSEQIKKINTMLKKGGKGTEYEADLKKSINKTRNKIEELTKKTNPNLVDEEFRLNMWINGKEQEYESTWDEIKKILSEFKKKVDYLCPKCGSALGKVKLKELREKNKVKLKALKKKTTHIHKELEDLKIKYKAAKESITHQNKYTLEISKRKLVLKKLNGLWDELTAQKALINQKTQKELPALKKNSQKLKDKKRVLQENRQREKDDMIVRLEGYKKDLAHITKRNEIDTWLIKDPLSSTGIRAYIFDSMLQDLNKHLEEYFIYTGFAIKVYIDLESARKDINISIDKGGQEISYWDLSKGQKQLTEYILAFAFNDTTTQSKPINVFLTDEVFESLSKNNVEIISNIIMKKAKTHAVHIITHLPSFKPVGAKKITLALNSKGNTVKVGE